MTHMKFAGVLKYLGALFTSSSHLVLVMSAQILGPPGLVEDSPLPALDFSVSLSALAWSQQSQKWWSVALGRGERLLLKENQS